MARQSPFVAFVVVLLGFQSATALRAVRNEATPVEKVVQLLTKLEKQVSEEGAKEAAEYDKYACFCKEQADAKTYAIEKSDEKIKSLTATIDDLDAEITELGQDIIKLGDEITTLKDDIKTEKDAREAEHDDFKVADENVTEAIKAVDDAIRAMKASKGKMEDAKLDLAQVADKASKVAMMSKVHPSASQVKAVTALVSAAKPGEPAKYEYRSNDIISTLQSLSVQFKENKKELYEAEMDAKAASEKKVLAWENEKKFKEKAKLEKEELESKKSEEKATAENEKQEETDDMDADIAFRTELTKQCEDRATEWDQRSKARAAELTALSEAREILKSGVATNYGANKKLVGLASKSAKVQKAQPKAKAVAAAAPKAKAAKKGAPSLLQVGSVNSGAAVAVHNIVEHLNRAAGKLHSQVLAALATKVEMQEDHFVKVRGLINDLIAKLEQEALDEADAKSFCDKEMGSAVGSRDDQKLAMEEEAATITEEESKVQALKEEIAVLSKEIAELNKALNEATQLRQEEKAENEKTLAEAAAGKTAVEQAITVLEEFYNNAFVQKGSKQPDADREGKTVSDRAPEMSYSGDYKGSQDASSGIIGLLNVILSDFERTESTVTQDESDAESEFTTFETDTNDSIDGKEKSIDTKEGEIKTAEEAITTAKDALMTAKRLHEDSLKELEKLKTMCVEGEESYAERKKKREQEIESLKEAMKILENWKD